MLNVCVVKGPSIYHFDIPGGDREYRVCDIEMVRYIARSLLRRGRHIFPVVVDMKMSIRWIDHETGYHEVVGEMTFLQLDGTIESKTMRRTGRYSGDGSGMVFSAWSGVDHAYYILYAPF